MASGQADDDAWPGMNPMAFQPTGQTPMFSRIVSRASAVLAIAFFVAGSVFSQQDPLFHTVEFNATTSLPDAAHALNQKFKELFVAAGQNPVTSEELINALALGNGFYLRPEKNEVADLCVDCFNTGTLPRGSGLAICLGERIGPSGNVQLREVFFVYLLLDADPPADKVKGNVPSRLMLARSALVPVRLAPRNVKASDGNKWAD